MPDAPLWFFSLPAILLLVLSHFASDALKFLDSEPRSAWLSVAGGVSVAYVFVHLMPEIAEAQHHVSELDSWPVGVLDHHAYLIALLGLVMFYGLDRLAHRVKSDVGSMKDDAMRPVDQGGDRAAHRVFWLHLASFAVYNLIIGYMLTHRDDTQALPLCLYAVAMSLHFLVNDHGLRMDFGRAWKKVGRWVLVGALILGWLAGLAFEASELGLSALVAFLGGGVVLNVLREELPEDRQSRFSAFLIGAVAYSALLLAT